MIDNSNVTLLLYSALFSAGGGFAGLRICDEGFGLVESRVQGVCCKQCP